MYIDWYAIIFNIVTIHTAYKAFTEVGYSEMAFGKVANFQQNSVNLTSPF